MFQCFREKDRYVYHYTKAKAAKSIIRGNTLNFSKYVKTNDPKEIKDWVFSIGTNENRDLGKYELEGLSKEMTKGLKDQTYVICFSLDGELTGDWVKDIYKRGFCKPRMWTQYADKHNGVCLIFEKDEIERTIFSKFSSIMAIYSDPVIYKNRSLIPNLSNTPYMINIDCLEKLGRQKYFKAHMDMHYKRLFFEKCKDWATEDEYRWVLFGTKDRELSFNYGSSLVGVVFGLDCKESTISKIEKECKGKNVCFEQLVWEGCSPRYSYNTRFWP